MRSAINVVAAALAMACAGCGTDSPPEEATPRPEPVVVYVDQPGEAALRPVFAAFTEASGIPVTIREADRAKNLDDVMSNRGAPPADVLVTDNVGDIWAAGDDGALRMLDDGVGLGAMPVTFRDPDGQWFVPATTVFVIVLGASADDLDPRSLKSLTEPAYEGRVCVVSSESPDTQALIAGLIVEHGERPAEIIARQWQQNLARAPLPTGKRVIDAVVEGSCDVGIVTTRDLRAADNAPPRSVRPAIVYRNGFGVGLARHARYPESGRELVAWLARPENRQRFAEAALADAVGDDEAAYALAAVGWRFEEARLLAERARWR